MNKCPKCDAPMVSLVSINVRICVDCRHEQPNILKEGQKTLIKATR